MKKFFTILLFLCGTLALKAQVKIGDNPSSINSNSLLELESTNKGFLPPRVALNNAASVAPLTGTVPAGMLVFSSGGSLANGYYYWDGSNWKMLTTNNNTVVSKTANATLTKTENIVLASNDITITLPSVTVADNGLTVTVKNTGTHTDLVTVQGYSSATIDQLDSDLLIRWVGRTYVAEGGNWIIKEKKILPSNVYEVNANGSWTSLDEIMEFLEEHMSAPSVIRLDGDSYEISSTITVDLPYEVTFQGISYGHTTIVPAAGIQGHPLFRCLSDCYFKMLEFDATALNNYGNNAGEDCIRFLGVDTYNEVKDCSFTDFYNSIIDSSNAELWVFECDIMNAKRNGILIQSTVPGVTVKVAETDFIGCARGINLDKASGATIQLASGGYYNNNANDTAIIYKASTFINAASVSIKGNLWNNLGKYIEGFDFSRTDGRDANVIMEGNAGTGDKKPYCFINVLNSNTIQNLANANTWYKADWGTNTSSTTCKWIINNNKISFQPVNHRNGIFNIAGNIETDQNNRVISIGIVKNGNTAVRYGETTLRVTSMNQPFQFSFVVYLDDIAPGDYFEIYYSSANSGDNLKIQDIQWLVNTQ